ncbi:hypothetical protein SERLA73DRAFT_95476, partial [Serpula lacrymans var. lacrymans S7.3]
MSGARGCFNCGGCAWCFVSFSSYLPCGQFRLIEMPSHLLQRLASSFHHQSPFYLLFISFVCAVLTGTAVGSFSFSYFIDDLCCHITNINQSNSDRNIMKKFH